MEEKEMVKSAVEISRVMAEAIEKYDKQNKRLWTTVVLLCLSIVIMAGCMVWGVQNAQRIANEATAQAIRESQQAMNEAMLNALNSVAEIGVTEETTTTTTTQTVEGESATINNGEWEQFNDNSAKNGGNE